MSVEEHEVFTWPADHTKIWRYVDLPKYLAMLQTRALFFCRLDRLGDPFEGSLTRATLDLERATVEHMFAEMGALTDSQKEARVDELSRNMSRVARAIRRWCAVNCWHVNDHESAAMWDIYARAGAGVAIQSTFRGLRRSLEGAESKVYLGKVSYVDYSSAVIPRRNLFAAIMTKRKSFEHDQELRAVVSEWAMTPTDELDFDGSLWETGLNVDVELTELVERICVAPTAPEWFAEVIRRVTARYGFEWSVDQSSLLGEPLF